MGPSKGMPESISAAEAALMASTSWGFSWSAPMTVMTTWVSLRKPSGNDGRSGPVDEAAGEDGLLAGAALPAEEGAGDLAGRVGPLLDVDGEGEEVDALAHAVGGVGGGEHGGAARWWRRTAPCDCRASLPVSKVRVLSVPETGPLTRMASAMVGLLSGRAGLSPDADRERRGSSQSATPRHPGSSRLTTDHAAPQRPMALLFPFDCWLFANERALTGRSSVVVVQRRRPSLAMIAR